MAQNTQAVMDVLATQPHPTSSQPKKSINFQMRPEEASPSHTPQSRLKPQNVTHFAATAALETKKSRDEQ